MKRILTVVVLFVSLNVMAQSAKDQAVWKQAEALTKAVFETKDRATLQTLVSDHVTYGHSGGNIENKTEMVNNAASSPTKYKNLEFEKVSMNVQDKVAVLRHNLRAISVDDKGAESPLNLGILQVWKKENGKWRIWARQAVRIAPKN